MLYAWQYWQETVTVQESAIVQGWTAYISYGGTKPTVRSSNGPKYHFTSTEYFDEDTSINMTCWMSGDPSTLSNIAYVNPKLVIAPYSSSQINVQGQSNRTMIVRGYTNRNYTNINKYEWVLVGTVYDSNPNAYPIGGQSGNYWYNILPVKF